MGFDILLISAIYLAELSEDRKSRVSFSCYPKWKKNLFDISQNETESIVWTERD